MDERTIYRRKQIMLIAGGVLFFFTSMSKMLIPGVLFGELQVSLGYSAATLGTLGAVFMYSYAISQLAIGIFSDRYGGSRLLVGGGSAFAVGMILTALSSSAWLMGFSRGLTALGAGVVFLGLAKLLNDLFPKYFTMSLGIALLVGYLGPAAGGVPITLMAEHANWRVALGVPAAISFLTVCVIVISSRGTFKAVQKGFSLAPLFSILKSRQMWCLFGCSSVIFGGYYAMLTTFGMKCLTDIVGFSTATASTQITVQATLIAINCVLFNFVLMLVKNRRKVMVYGGSICALAGGLLAYLTLKMELPRILISASFILITLPAGFFAIYSTIAKELASDENVGIAVAVLNFFAFVAIAFSGQIAALLLQKWESVSPKGETGYLYPAAAYEEIFLFLVFLGAFSLVCAFGFPETKDAKTQKEEVQS